ncbi:uncharacterized protein [Typha latifolia]|uniref:uncharacterized protein isoform X2 n=1 Tax=Typha latifolia TaxID=4733 RepID=UPI003C309AE8
MRRVGKADSPGVVRVSDSSPESSFRELDDVFLQTQARIWLGEVLHLRFNEETSVADLLADGELLFQVSKVVWKMLLKKYAELKQSKVYIYERTSFGKSDGRYMAYPKVDSFLKICQILGLTGVDLFCPSDVVEKRDIRRVCMCIRSLSKRARLKNLNVPDFDVVTYTIAMPTDIVGGICRNLEKSSCSLLSSNGYSSSVKSREIYSQRSFSGHHDHQYDSYYDSDEAESSFTEYHIPLASASLESSKVFNIAGINPHEDTVSGKDSAFYWLRSPPHVDMEDSNENWHTIDHGEPMLVESMDLSNASPIKTGNHDSTFAIYKKEFTPSINTGKKMWPFKWLKYDGKVNNIKVDSLYAASSSEGCKNDLDTELLENAEEKCTFPTQCFPNHEICFADSCTTLAKAGQGTSRHGVTCHNPEENDNVEQEDMVSFEEIQQNGCIWSYTSHESIPACSNISGLAEMENGETTPKAYNNNGENFYNNSMSSYSGNQLNENVSFEDSAGHLSGFSDFVFHSGVNGSKLCSGSEVLSGSYSLDMETADSNGGKIIFGLKRKSTGQTVNYEVPFTTSNSISENGSTGITEDKVYCKSPTEFHCLKEIGCDIEEGIKISIVNGEEHDYLTTRSCILNVEEEGMKSSSLNRIGPSVMLGSRDSVDWQENGSVITRHCMKNEYMKSATCVSSSVDRQPSRRAIMNDLHSTCYCTMSVHPDLQSDKQAQQQESCSVCHYMTRKYETDSSFTSNTLYECSGSEPRNSCLPDICCSPTNATLVSSLNLIPDNLIAEQESFFTPDLELVDENKQPDKLTEYVDCTAASNTLLDGESNSDSPMDSQTRIGKTNLKLNSLEGQITVCYLSSEFEGNLETKLDNQKRTFCHSQCAESGFQIELKENISKRQCAQKFLNRYSEENYTLKSRKCGSTSTLVGMENEDQCCTSPKTGDKFKFLFTNSMEHGEQVLLPRKDTIKQPSIVDNGMLSVSIADSFFLQQMHQVNQCASGNAPIPVRNYIEEILTILAPKYKDKRVLHGLLSYGALESSAVFSPICLRKVHRRESTGIYDVVQRGVQDLDYELISNNEYLHYDFERNTRNRIQLKDDHMHNQELTLGHIEEAEGDTTTEQPNEVSGQFAHPFGGFITSIKCESADETEMRKQERGDNNSKLHNPVKKLLKSVASGITIVAALFVFLHLRKISKEKNCRKVVPLQAHKSSKEDSRHRKVQMGKSDALYPREWLNF